MASKIEKLQKKSDNMLEELSYQADKTRDSFVDLLGAAVEMKSDELFAAAIDLASVIEHQAIVSGIAATLNLLMDEEDDDGDEDG